MLQNFETALSREQMKHILGGMQEEELGGDCTATCEEGERKCSTYDVMCVGGNKEWCVTMGTSC
jgi:hypothetical protein